MTNIVYKTAGEVAEASSVAAGDDFLLSVGGQARRVPRDTIRNFAGIFATTPDLKAATGLTNGSTYNVTLGYNREPETFVYTTSGATADEDVIIAATGMGTGYLISRRTNRATVADLVADRRTFASGVYLMAGGFAYVTVAADEHLTLAGGQKVQHVAVNNTFHLLALNPNADGVTDDSALIDHLNQVGYILDLGGKDYEYAGSFTATATFTNGRIIDDNRTYDYRPRTGETTSTVGQGRGRINYQSPDAIRVYGLADEIALGGFRYWGQYLKGRGPVKKVNNGGYSHATVSAANSQGVLNTAKTDQWYAVFAVANDEDEYVSFVLVPYLRCYSRAGKVITLATTKQGTNGSPATVTLDVNVDRLAGVDCLVIAEGGRMVGRTTKITANTATTVTLQDEGTITQLDTLLPAPPGYDHYHYLGTAYWETSSPGDWRNIADGVYLVESYMGGNNLVPSSGAMTNQKILYGCDISPLATGVHFSFMCTYSGGNKGSMGHNIYHDGSNHAVWRRYLTRSSLDNTILEGMGTITFSGEQALWHSTGGSSDSSAITARTVVTYGWIEP